MVKGRSKFKKDPTLLTTHTSKNRRHFVCSIRVFWVYFRLYHYTTVIKVSALCSVYLANEILRNKIDYISCDRASLICRNDDL